MSDDERCLECMRPVGDGDRECPRLLLGASDDDHADCAHATIYRLKAELCEEREARSLSDMRWEAELAQANQRLEREKELSHEIYQSERRVFEQCNERIVAYETELKRLKGAHQ